MKPIERWQKDFLEGETEEVIIRRCPSKPKRKVSFTEFGDVRLNLKLAANRLEDDMDAELGTELSELKKKIAKEKLPQRTAAQRLESSARSLVRNKARQCCDLIGKRIVQLDAKRDPEFDREFSQEEREELYTRFRHISEALLVKAGFSAKGNIELLQGHTAVTSATAARYLGITRRAIELAVEKGTLITIGKGHNKKITVLSLLAYLPPN